MTETEQRAAIVAEAHTWIGTPFRDQGATKGLNGCVDCAMLLVRVFTKCGLVDASFDPRPYPPQWHLHNSEERFLGVITALLESRGKGKEVLRSPIPGDVIVWRVARCFSHGGIIVENNHVIHAYYRSQRVAISGLHESELALLPTGKPRPFKLFDLWAS